MGHQYISHRPDDSGFINYSQIEHDTWAKLIARQNPVVKDKAHPLYLEGLKRLNFPHDRIPQHSEVSQILNEYTGWGVEPVAALIPATQFFTLLSNKKFPAASFIRIPEELNYIEEPDIFHEFYGHCPLITEKPYAHFLHEIGKVGLTIEPKLRKYVFRLFWFTIEFGLIKTPSGLVSYGGGILSSIHETVSCLTDPKVERQDFDLMNVLRTDYRIDIPQPLYFVINSLDQVYELAEIDIASKINQAYQMGDLPVKYPPRTVVAADLVKREVDC